MVKTIDTFVDLCDVLAYQHARNKHRHHHWISAIQQELFSHQRLLISSEETVIGIEGHHGDLHYFIFPLSRKLSLLSDTYFEQARRVASIYERFTGEKPLIQHL